MAKKSIFEPILEQLREILDPKSKYRKLIGEDHFGTKYYEESLSPQSMRTKPPRYFEPIDKGNSEQEIPLEWQAWLRYSRKDPPTQEEINNNYKRAVMVKENVAKLESQYAKPSKDLQIINQKDIRSFPVYEEYKNFGLDYKLQYSVKRNKCIIS